MSDIIRSSTLPSRGLSAKSAKRIAALAKRTTVCIDRCIVTEMNRLARELRAANRVLAQQARESIRRPAFQTRKPAAPKMLNQVRDYKATKRVNVSV